MNIPKELIERVEKATENDRDLFTLVAFTIGAISPADMDPFKDRWFTLLAAEAYTDAALALTERMLPGWTIARMSQGDNKLWTVELREGFLTSYNRVVIQPDHWHGTTLPIAIVLATLRALESKP